MRQPDGVCESHEGRAQVKPFAVFFHDIGENLRMFLLKVGGDCGDHFAIGSQHYLIRRQDFFLRLAHGVIPFRTRLVMGSLRFGTIAGISDGGGTFARSARRSASFRRERSRRRLVLAS